MAAPVLAASYAVHMAATVIWIGGLVFLAFFASPMFRRLPETERAAAIEGAARRFVPLAWLCLAAFVVTGLIQMSASPRYVGLLTVRDDWSAAILAKHIVVAAMAGLLAYQTWIVHPRLERARLGLTETAPAEVAALRRTEARLIRWGAWLGLLVLLLTAFARASA
jgi:uncharacterized membrane protein